MRMSPRTAPKRLSIKSFVAAASCSPGSEIASKSISFAFILTFADLIRDRSKPLNTSAERCEVSSGIGSTCVAIDRDKDPMTARLVMALGVFLKHAGFFGDAFLVHDGALVAL